MGNHQEAVLMDYAKAYEILHMNPKHFAGWTLCKYASHIAGLVELYGAETLLDYGSGKGYQYLAARAHEPWGILPHCYDPGVRQLSKKPEGQFDGVICTDVLEHIEEQDVPEILADILGYATKFVFLSIACRPAKRKKLPDGRNVHLTVKPPEWWTDQVSRALKEAKVSFRVTTVFDQ